MLHDFWWLHAILGSMHCVHIFSEDGAKYCKWQSNVRYNNVQTVHCCLVS